MNNTLKTMIKIWNIKKMDWLGYENDERYSYHHLKKKSDGGKTTIENGSILHQSTHQYLHTIELYEYDMYLRLNQILKDVNKQRTMTTKEQLEEIKFILLSFQRLYEHKENSRGKLIIKDEYKLVRCK